MTKKRKKASAATAGAVALMLATIHLADKASGAECEPNGPCTTVPTTLAKPTRTTKTVLNPPPEPFDSYIDPCGDFSTKDYCAEWQADHPPQVLLAPAASRGASVPSEASATTNTTTKPKKKAVTQHKATAVRFSLVENPPYVELVP